VKLGFVKLDHQLLQEICEVDIKIQDTVTSILTKKTTFEEKFPIISKFMLLSSSFHKLKSVMNLKTLYLLFLWKIVQHLKFGETSKYVVACAIALYIVNLEHQCHQWLSYSSFYDRCFVCSCSCGVGTYKTMANWKVNDNDNNYNNSQHYELHFEVLQPHFATQWSSMALEIVSLQFPKKIKNIWKEIWIKVYGKSSKPNLFSSFISMCINNFN
jgi:hypothetical protein